MNSPALRDQPASGRPGLRPCAWVAVAAGLLLSGAGARADGATAARAPADPMAAVQRLIGDAACRSDADCRTVGVGHRACGGPLSYLPWSAWRTSAHALQQAAAATREPVPAAGEGTVSTCQVPVDPGARCIGASAGAPGTCRLRQDAPVIR